VANCLLWTFFSVEKHPVRGSGVDGAGDNMWASTASIDVAADQFAALGKRPNVVLLGSSLIMNTFWLMDRFEDPNLPDVFHWRNSRVLERALTGAGAGERTVFNMANFGQMVSDSYIWTNEFLKGARKPDVVVLGIAPRDFYDADLSALMSTFTFKRIVGLKNFAPYSEAFLPRWQDKLDFVMAHTCFLYGKRWRLQHEVTRGMERSCEMLGITRQKTVVRPSAEDLNRGGFLLAALESERWSNSVKEYRRRYENIGNHDLSVQYGFLSKLLDLCRQRGIKVILVDMPLSSANRNLMPSQFYETFRARVRAIATVPGVTYIDLGDSTAFTHSDFWDTAHLSQSGGQKLVATILPALVTDLNQPRRGDAMHRP
jgi:hypothetical protein